MCHQWKSIAVWIYFIDPINKANHRFVLFVNMHAVNGWPANTPDLKENNCIVVWFLSLSEYTWLIHLRVCQFRSVPFWYSSTWDTSSPFLPMGDKVKLRFSVLNSANTCWIHPQIALRVFIKLPSFQWYFQDLTAGCLYIQGFVLIHLPKTPLQPITQIRFLWSIKRKTKCLADFKIIM